jgi:dipeptidyl-peptidase-4
MHSAFCKSRISSRRLWHKGLLVGMLSLGSAPASLAQQPAVARLTLERIFASREFAPEFPAALRWFDDSTYTTVQVTAGASEIVAVHVPSGRSRVLVSADMLRPSGSSAALEVEDYQWSTDRGRVLIFSNSARVWRENTRGDFWVLDIQRRTLRKLGGPNAAPSSLQFAKFSPDGRRVAYVREHDIYVESLDDGRIVRLTNDGSRTIINGTFDWVYEEELFMRDGFRWSPDGRHIAYWQLDASGVRDFLLINNTDSLYSFVIPVQYPKAGTTNSAARIGVVSAEGGPTTWMQIPGDPRNHYLARMDWAANDSQIVVQQLNRLQNSNTFWIANAGSGTARVLFVERDSAWVDIYDDHVNWGPGPSLQWLPDRSAFVFLSERDGWRHAWLVDRAGTMRLVTPGSYDVMEISYVDLRGGWLYFYASPDDPTRMYLYRSRLGGSGTAQRLTPASMPGSHRYRIAPNARYAIHTWSSWGSPPITEIVRLPDHTAVQTLVSNDVLRERLAAIAKGRVEFFRVPNAEGVPLDAWMMYPPDFDPGRKYPVLFYVYGEPWGQTVVDSYGGNVWLWHLMLTQQGYIVASVDNRGTPAPRGRAWRKAVYKRIGTIRVADQSAAARAIAQRPYVDSARFAVWGWSGGGSSTLLLMFRAPELYKVGMAVAPVANVRNYDTIYQERYLGLPDTDPEAYRDASAIYFAEGLRGHLLVAHGTGDDNVHYQSTEQLIDALIAAGKQFTVMPYPNRSHGIYEGRGTTLHLFTLLTRFLQEHLPAGAR